MPIYEYKCPKCGVFEAMQRITEPSLKKCPTCKSKVERQISRGSFILKGSGWYATDYARSNGKSESGGDSVTKDATSSDSAGKDTVSSSDSAKTPTAESGKPPSSEKTTTAKSTD